MSAGLVRKHFNITASSDEAAGATNKSADGSSFNVKLNRPFEIPPDAINITAEALSTTIWWTVPNIITGENDQMSITGPDTLDVTQTYNITLEQGLYDLAGLNEAILRELETAGAKVDPEPIVNFTPDNATQKVVLRLEYDDSDVDFTIGQTPRIILGFEALVYGPPGVGNAPDNVLAPNVAAFNTINSFFTHTNLVEQGMLLNAKYDSILGQVLIDEPPGSLITSEPFHSTRSPAGHLAGSKLTNLHFWLTDEKLQPVNTANENWTVRVAIRYEIPILIGSGGVAVAGTSRGTGMR
jgi:hypothetical protein